MTINVKRTNDHGDIRGLSDDDHTQYALLTGRSGGQTLIGGIDSGDDLTLESTSNATKGQLILKDWNWLVGDNTDKAFLIEVDTDDVAHPRLRLTKGDVTTPQHWRLDRGGASATDNPIITNISGGTHIFTSQPIASPWSTSLSFQTGNNFTWGGLHTFTNVGTHKIEGSLQVDGILYGGDGASEDLTLESTSHATKGNLIFQSGTNKNATFGKFSLVSNGGDMYLVNQSKVGAFSTDFAVRQNSTGYTMINANNSFFLDMGSGGNIRFRIGSNYAELYTTFRPDTDNARDLGTSSLGWKDIYISGNAFLDTGMEVALPAINSYVRGFDVAGSGGTGIHFFRYTSGSEGDIIFGTTSNIYHRFGALGSAKIGDVEHTDGTSSLKYDASLNTLTLSNGGGAFVLPQMTTTQRDAMTPANGWMIYNTTTNTGQIYEAGAWRTI